MENNNSRQVMLSIIGVAVLVIAVVGVSFAFFTYSREGTKNNVITTGSITFELAPNEDGHPNIDGANSFPQTNAEAVAETTGDKNKTDFDVTGTLPAGASNVTYWVYVIEGSEPTGEGITAPTNGWKRFKNSEISMQVKVAEEDAEAIKIENAYDGPKSLDGGFTTDLKDGSGQGILIATGTLAAGTSIDHNYSLYMWINDSVTISDTDYSYKYRASTTDEGDQPLKNVAGTEAVDPTKLPVGTDKDDRPVYTDYYYSVKIKVVASDDPSLVTP